MRAGEAGVKTLVGAVTQATDESMQAPA